MENRDPYITVTQGMSGWFAVELQWAYLSAGMLDEIGFYEPYQTGVGRYATKEEAIEEGKLWAEDEGIEFKE